MPSGVAAGLALALGLAAHGPRAWAQEDALRPPIVTREQWGSRPHPIPEERRHVPAWVTIHHAGVPWRRGTDPAAFLRNMQDWGQNRPTREPPPRNTYWPDLPYHFLIAPDGRVFEGRPVEYEPESNTRYPLSGNIGVELMGDFDSLRPSARQLESLARLSAWLLRRFALGPERLRGHRDAAPGQTSCPGRDLYRYLEDGALRGWVEELLAGGAPTVRPGPPLPNGPTRTIEP